MSPRAQHHSTGFDGGSPSPEGNAAAPGVPGAALRSADDGQLHGWQRLCDGQPDRGRLHHRHRTHLHAPAAARSGSALLRARAADARRARRPAVARRPAGDPAAQPQDAAPQLVADDAVALPPAPADLSLGRGSPLLLGELHKILVPLDLSPASLEALREAVDIAGETGASVVLLTVIDTRFPFPELYSLEDPDHDFFRTMRETALARMKDALGELPEVPAERLVVRGRAKTEIAAMARELEVDLIVMTSHGSGGFREAVLGGTTDAVVRQAPCPVLVLPI